MPAGRPSKLTPEMDFALAVRVAEEIAIRQSLAVIHAAADNGDKDAAAWLRGEGYIHVTNAPHRSFFVRYTNQFERHSTDARRWTKAVYKRDGFTCRECGQVGGRLNAHHVKSWAEFPDLRYELSNGVTLCEGCHARHHPHLGMFQRGKKRT
jgi:5-methylcytosine-specific restriction endonuclease McrA